MEAWVIPVALASPLVLFGLLLVASGLHVFWTGRLLKRDWGTASGIESGFVKLFGTASAREQIVTAPFSGRQCLAYRATIENVNNEPEHQSPEPNWESHHTVEETRPFELETATGTVTVDLAETDWGLPNDHIHIVNSGDSPDGPYASFVEDHDIYLLDDEGITESHEVRFTETRVEPGDDLAVLGRVDDSGIEPRLGTADPLLAPSPFELAETKESLDESGEGGLVLAAAGLLFAGFPLLLLYGIFF